MNDIFNSPAVSAVVELALREDIGTGDLTTAAIFGGGERCRARVIAKEQGIFCGGELAGIIYGKVDPAVKIDIIVRDGREISSGETALVCEGPTAGILTGERTVLNFLQRMCGIATKTGGIVSLLRGTGIEVLDTRKTAPGMRLLDKYAVKAGGGRNHRMGLFDMVMIKDNHIKGAGSIAEAVKKVRALHGDAFTVEVETTTLEEVREALEAGADIIMLDNMDTETMAGAVRIIKGKAKTEISGNVDERRIAELKKLKVDYISIGALTHSVKAFDLSMKFD